MENRPYIQYHLAAMQKYTYVLFINQQLLDDFETEFNIIILGFQLGLAAVLCKLILWRKKKSKAIFASSFLNIHRYLMLQSLRKPAFLCSFVHFSTEYCKGYLVFQT